MRKVIVTALPVYIVATLSLMLVASYSVKQSCITLWIH